MKNVSFLIVTLLIMLAFGGCREERTPEEIQYLNDFHKAYFVSQQDMLEKDSLALYVDYSTCISQAMGDASNPASPFYVEMVPTLVKATKTYWSIKGSDIAQEEGDVYTLLKSVTEVNYADLATAANQIAGGNTEAVLLTDGEYYVQTKAKSHVNDPYMSNAIEKWLKRGHDIYVFSEKYTEIYNGSPYKKKRFYFLFTDCRIEGNIFEMVTRNVDFEKFPYVKYYHLTANNPTLMTTNHQFNSSSTPDSLLECTPDGHGSYEIQDWSNMPWKYIEQYIIQSYDETTGELIPGGKAVISGLKLDKNFQGGCYRIEDIELVVSSINKEYTDFVDSINAGMKPCQIADCLPINNLTKYDHFLKIDAKEFGNHGNINIHFDTENYDPSILDGSPYNYFKIDIVVKSFSNNFSHNETAESIFEFQSIENQNSGEINRSIAESIKQAVSRPDVANMIQGRTIYSIYVKSNKY